LVDLCHFHHLSFYLKATARYLSATAYFLNRLPASKLFQVSN
jgi:hypothetical protein